MLLALLSLPSLCSGADVKPLGFRFTPYVIRADQRTPVLLEVAISGAPTTVLLECPQATLLMTDNGAGGDVAAGDGVYTVRLDSAQVTAGM